MSSSGQLEAGSVMFTCQSTHEKGAGSDVEPSTWDWSFTDEVRLRD